MDIVFASNNTHKLEEIKSMLPSSISLLSLADIGFDHEIEESAPDFKGNALIKAQAVHAFCSCNCFADDSGLEVEALGWKPGVHSARYAGKQGDHEANNQKLLMELEGLSNRKARFRTVIALIWDGKTQFFEGVVSGRIARKPSGAKGFGYDPLFIPDGYTQSFAEMELAQKNSMSHRARALQKMMVFLKNVTGDFQPGVSYC